MILYYSTKFHFIIIDSFRVIGRGHFPPPPPPPQAESPSKSPGGIGLKLLPTDPSKRMWIHVNSSGYTYQGLQRAVIVVHVRSQLRPDNCRRELNYS